LLHFLKSKPFLRDLIPNNCVDIHSHLLPGIDDGAKTIEDTISLMQQMKAIGFENIITTPHIITNVWDNTESSIEKKHEETTNTIKNKNIDATFSFAAEYMMDANLIKRIEKGKLLTIKDNFVLVEISYICPPLQLYDIIFELQLEGYKPILAHPERYLFYHTNFQEFDKLKQSGCLFQLNLLSTVGYYGPKISHIANELLKKGLINFVGSDIHHQNHLDAFNKKIEIKNQKELEKAIANNLFFLK
jgi:tyrosine-protein phosphatase YwqE